MSQKDRILGRMKAGSLCAMEPLDWTPRIYRVAARVKDLRDDGHQIITGECVQHPNGTPHAVYRLIDPDQARLFL